MISSGDENTFQYRLAYIAQVVNEARASSDYDDVLLLDGGLSIAKISLKRFLKVSILKNVRTPIHDHFRKNKGWSDTQTVYRFVIVQIVICFVVLCLC